MVNDVARAFFEAPARRTICVELPEEETHDSATRTLRDQGCERQLPGGGQVGVDQSVVQERQVQPQHVLRRWAKAPHHRFEFHLFRVLLLRRLHLPLPPCLPSPPLRADGEPHRRCLDEDGVALTFARRRPERTYPEVTSGRSSAKLVVVARETHSRFSEETQTFLRLVAGLGLAPCPSRCALAPASLSCTDGAPLLSCAAARAFACSLLGVHGNLDTDGDAPSVTDVLGDFCNDPIAD